MSEPTTFAIHVDCDPLWIYEREYGVTLGQSEAVYEQALPAFLDLFRDLNVKATFFVIGSELGKASCQRFCQRALSAGHTLGNHSNTHPTNFASVGPEQRRAEITECHNALRGVGGTPLAYRSPGYFHSEDVERTLGNLGYLYDSSILPGFATLLMSAYLRASGQAKDKSFGVRQNLFASRQISRGSNGLLRVPLAVIPFWRLPIHSTFVYQFGLRYLEFGLSALRRDPGHHVILFHAIDLLDRPVDPASPIVPLRWPTLLRHRLVTRMVSAVSPNVVITEHLIATLRS